MSKKKVKTIEELEAALVQLELNLNNPTIMASPMMLGSMKKRIEITKAEIAARKKESGKATTKKEPVAKVVKTPKEKVVKEKKVKAEKPAKVKKEPKEIVTALTKKDIADLKANPKVAKVLEIVFPKHLVQYKLHLLKLSTEEIMALTGSPKPATIRNIWYYTSGKKSL